MAVLSNIPVVGKGTAIIQRRGLSTGGSVGLTVGLSSLLLVIAVAACSMARSASKRRRRRSRSRDEKKDRHRPQTQQHQSHHSQEHVQHHVQNVNIQHPEPTHQHQKQSGQVSAGYEGWTQPPNPWTWHGPNVSLHLPEIMGRRRPLSLGDMMPEYEHERGRRRQGSVRSNEATAGRMRDLSPRSRAHEMHRDRSQDADPRLWRAQDHRHSHPGHSMYEAQGEPWPAPWASHPHEPHWGFQDPHPYGSHNLPVYEASRHRRSSESSWV